MKAGLHRTFFGPGTPNCRQGPHWAGCPPRPPGGETDRNHASGLRASSRAWSACSGALARKTFRCVCGPEIASMQPHASVFPTPFACGARAPQDNLRRRLLQAARVHVAIAALAGRPELATTSIAGALSSHSAPLGKRLFDHILHIFAAAGAPGCQILFTRGRAKKKVVGESQKREKLRPAAPTPESSAQPRSSHVTASCGFTECLQAIDRHATAKQGIRD
jgi:hypothetical protein